MQHNTTEHIVMLQEDPCYLCSCNESHERLEAAKQNVCIVIDCQSELAEQRKYLRGTKDYLDL